MSCATGVAVATQTGLGHEHSLMQQPHLIHLICLHSFAEIRLSVQSTSAGTPSSRGEARPEQDTRSSGRRLSGLSRSATHRVQLPQCPSHPGYVRQRGNGLPGLSCVPRWTWGSPGGLVPLHQWHHLQPEGVRLRLVVQCQVRGGH